MNLQSRLLWSGLLITQKLWLCVQLWNAPSMVKTSSKIAQHASRFVTCGMAGHADVNIMRHMLEHFSFVFWTLQCQHCMSTLWLLHTLFVYALCVASVFFCFCCSTLLLLHVMLFVCTHCVCVYNIEKGFGSYICTCNMRTYTSILCAHTRAHLQPFEINIVQHLINMCVSTT